MCMYVCMYAYVSLSMCTCMRVCIAHMCRHAYVCVI